MTNELLLGIKETQKAIKRRNRIRRRILLTRQIREIKRAFRDLMETEVEFLNVEFTLKELILGFIETGLFAAFVYLLFVFFG